MNAERVVAWVAAGSNLGDRAAYLLGAREGLRQTEGVETLRASDVEETAPLGGRTQPPYLNQMFRVTTTLDARALLARCHELERLAGRVRQDKWDSRTLDLDVVRYGQVLGDWPDLTLPHPGLRDRTFWAREIATLESHD